MIHERVGQHSVSLVLQVFTDLVLREAWKCEIPAINLLKDFLESQHLWTSSPSVENVNSYKLLERFSLFFLVCLFLKSVDKREREWVRGVRGCHTKVHHPSSDCVHQLVTASLKPSSYLTFGGRLLLIFSIISSEIFEIIYIFEIYKKNLSNTQIFTSQLFCGHLIKMKVSKEF